MAESTAQATGGLDVSILLCQKSDGQQFDPNRFPNNYLPAPPATERVWLSKLGDMLGELFYPNTGNKYVLAAFPEHYHLRVKYREDATSESASGVTSTVGKRPPKAAAAGKHDLYLYGYPSRQQTTRGGADAAALKAYRSPNEFFEHLCWLIEDGVDRSRCCCKHCKPTREPKGKARASKTPAPGAAGPPVEPSGDLGPPPLAPATTPATMPATNPTATPNPTLGTLAQGETSTALAANAVGNLLPDESYLFREGEVVWYMKTQAFRLGVIVRNRPGNPTIPTGPISTIMPLSHSFWPIEKVELPEADMRPFLTFTVPPVHASLEHVANLPMEQIPWNELAAQLPHDDSKKEEALSLEASKMGASRVDHTYSLFNPIVYPNAPPSQQFFGGVFFGCEKIGLYEAVRVWIEEHEHGGYNDPNLTFVMVVRQIALENIDNREYLLFRGGLWVLRETDSPEHSTDMSSITPAMRNEKFFRDGVKRAHGTHFDWELVAPYATKSSGLVRGRFYESQKLGPIVNPQWNERIRNGEIPPVHASLNNRGDSKSYDVGRKLTRSDAFAGILPPGTVLDFGPSVMEPHNSIHNGFGQ